MGSTSLRVLSSRIDEIIAPSSLNTSEPDNPPQPITVAAEEVVYVPSVTDVPRVVSQ